MCEAGLERGLKRPFIARSDSAPDNRPVLFRPHPVLSTLAVVLALGVPMGLASPPALAGSEQDRARAAVQAGQVLPLKAVLESLERDQLVDEACFAVQDLRLYWLDHAPKPETRRVEAKPGRNGPCPCGRN